MTEIVISTPVLRNLVESLKADFERGAALYLSHVPFSDRYLVHEVAVAGPDDCIHATETQITFAPQYLTRVTRGARQKGKALGLLHTHPRGFDNFSAMDDKAEAELAEFMLTRSPGATCFSLVLCNGKLIARKFGTNERVAVREIGDHVRLPSITGGHLHETRYDRQIRAFGKDGQDILNRLKVAIVGLGGTGSVAAQQLAYLGVENFALIDPDVVDESNLNRIVGANASSIGQRKVEIAAQMIRRIGVNTKIDSYAGTVISHDAVKLLKAVDCIFICTDSHVSRAFLSEFCYQYLVPAFDIGVSINARQAKVEAITGRTQMLAPGLPCLLCSNSLNLQQIREELMTEEQRAMDPYFNEGSVKQPAVISLNSAMVSMAMTMFLGAFTEIPAQARWQSYDALTGKVRLLSAKSLPECSVCGPQGVQAAGDSQALSFL